MPSRPATRERFSFANLDEVLPLPDLISIQRDSFKWFLEQGLADTFRDISPIEDFSGSLKLILEFDPTDQDLRPPPKFTVEECKEKDMTYAAPIFVRAQFQNANTGEIKEQTVFMGDFPMMTDKGTFIINGTERVVVSQLVRSPGVIFQPGRDAKTIVTGTIHPYRGEWIEFDVEAKPGKDITAGSRVARKRRLSLFVLLRALGYTDEGFLERFVRHFDFLEGQWEKERELAPTQEEALLEIYKRARPGEPPSAESARVYFENAFFNPKRYDLTRVGRYKLDRKLGPEIAKAEELFGIDLERPEPRARASCPGPRSWPPAATCCTWPRASPGYRLDDQDHFANRRIRSVGELIQNQVRVGLSRMERVVRERMTTQDVEAITPQTLINIRPVVAAIKEFFGTSQLSQFMDQTNPLSGPDPQAAPVGHGPRRPVPGAGRVRGAGRAHLPLRPHVPHRDAGGPQHRPDRPPGLLRAHQLLRLHRDPLPQGGRGPGHRRDRVPGRRRGGGVRHRPGQRQAGRRRHPDRGPGAGAPGPHRPGRPGRRGRHQLRHHQRGGLRAARRGGPDGRVAQADRLDLDRPDPLHRARRRQPGPHGRQHAEAGGAAGPARGALHRDRGRGPGRPRRRRRVCWPRARAPWSRCPASTSPWSTSPARATGSGTPLGRKVYRLAKFRRSNQNTCLNQRIVVDEGD